MADVVTATDDRMLNLDSSGMDTSVDITMDMTSTSAVDVVIASAAGMTDTSLAESSGIIS